MRERTSAWTNTTLPFHRGRPQTPAAVRPKHRTLERRVCGRCGSRALQPAPMSGCMHSPAPAPTRQPKLPLIAAARPPNRMPKNPISASGPPSSDSGGRCDLTPPSAICHSLCSPPVLVRPTPSHRCPSAAHCSPPSRHPDRLSPALGPVPLRRRSWRRLQRAAAGCHNTKNAHEYASS